MENSTTSASSNQSRLVKLGSCTALIAFQQVSCGTDLAEYHTSNERGQASGAESPSLSRTQQTRIASMPQPQELASGGVVPVELFDNRFVDLEIFHTSARETGVLVHLARQIKTGLPAYLAVDPRTGSMRVDVDDGDALYVTRKVGEVYKLEVHLRR